MKNIEENNLVRFINISKKKDGLFANFRLKGIHGGIVFSASIAVDISEAMTEDPASCSLEKIVEESAKIAIREFKKVDFQFEGLTAL
jgi:hypothetical protein